LGSIPFTRSTPIAPAPKTCSATHLLITIFEFTILHPLNYQWTSTSRSCKTSPTFDENLHEHTRHELADDAYRESDTPRPV
jgi:hypothetical protein